MNIGEPAIFSCTSATLPEWYYVKENILPKNVPFTTTDRILMPQVDHKKSGYYYCYGSYYMTEKHFLAKARLKVYSECYHFSFEKVYVV